MNLVDGPALGLVAVTVEGNSFQIWPTLDGHCMKDGTANALWPAFAPMSRHKAQLARFGYPCVTSAMGAPLLWLAGTPMRIVLSVSP